MAKERYGVEMLATLGKMNIFGGPEMDAAGATNIPLRDLADFEGHPYGVRDDEEMEKLVESIRQQGVLTPLLVRPKEDGGYEIISGHRRKHAAELAGKSNLPCIIREMDDDEAIISMVDCNCQRENILPSEKAKAYKMRMEAEQRKRGRPLIKNCGQLGHNFDDRCVNPKTRDLLADESGDSARQVQRYVRLNELLPELQEMVDRKQLAFNPAVELSYLHPEEQQEFLEYITEQECAPSLSQAQQLKKASREKTLDEDTLARIMTKAPSVPPREMRVTISVDKIARYFPENATTEEMAEQIIRLLQSWARARSKQPVRGQL